MDIRRIALYLAGKEGPDYIKYNRLLFMKRLETIFGYDYQRLDFYWNQSNKYEEDFYLMILDLIYQESLKDTEQEERFNKLLKELNISKSDSSLSNKLFDYKGLLNDFDNLIKFKTSKKDGKSQEKGRQFEEFLKKLFNSIDGLEVTKIKQAKDEQIDLIIKNNINKPFWLNLKSPVIIGEAKNWSTKTNTEVINTLRGKTCGHVNFSRLGIVISMNGFTEVVNSNLLRDGSSDRIIIAITGDDINKLLKDKISPVDWLEGLIMKSFI